MTINIHATGYDFIRVSVAMNRGWFYILLAGGSLLGGDAFVSGALARDSVTLERQFGEQIAPLLRHYCLDCHSTEKQKGDLDLERFASFQEVSRHPKVWEDVVEQVTLGEMPPKDKRQLSSAERQRLLDWVGSALNEVALAQAGDPGPVVLRRLNNAEYTFTVRDLTGVESLDPVREFPVDGAAGEGFMNTGNSLVMSPSLFSKYLDAGKEIASHAVLLPDGFRFSSATTRRDWGEEILAEIRELYRTYTDPTGGDQVNLQGIVFNTNEGGRLPVEAYLNVTLRERERLLAGQSIEAIAHQHGLSAKYLRSLWEVLNNSEPSLLLDRLRARWQTAKPEDAAALANDIAQWQKALWKYSSVGHIGKVGGPKAWMEPVSPLTSKQDLRLKLTAPTNATEVIAYLVVNDAGDGQTNDVVVWENPRLVAPGRPEVGLRDVRGHLDELVARRDRFLAATASGLAAASEVAASDAPADLLELARRHQLDLDALEAWLDYLGIGSSNVALDHFTTKIEKLAGYDFVQGWGEEGTPNLVANSSDQAVRIPGQLKARGVAVHPTPKLNVAVGWRSPQAMTLRIEGKVTHAHPECGNGVEWFVEVRRGKTRQRLASGVAQGAHGVEWGPIENVAVRSGDLVSLLIGPRAGDHSCDLTEIEFVLKGSDGREWNLAQDVGSDVLASNPHADRLGNDGIWHFYTEPVSRQETTPLIPTGSLLARWQAATSAQERESLATELQALLTAESPGPAEGPDAVLYRQARSLGGPLLAATRSAGVSGKAGSSSSWGLDPGQFGKLPNGTPLDAASLGVQAPSVIEIRLPADFAAGAELVTTATLHPQAGAEGSVQVQLTTSKPERISGLVAGQTLVTGTGGQWTSQNRQVSHSTPILVTEGSATQKRIEASLEEFRRWFPPALCYTKIVPVDEVVTLTLFHREDDHLARLMLDEREKARLDRLWREFRYVSQDALMLVDALEQIWQYATQDADPTVFEPMRQPVADRAAAFRQWLIDTEPPQVESLLSFASDAYRRPLTKEEKEELQGFYHRLRKEEIPHEEAIRLALARVFVAPAFLYRLEKAVPGANSGPVSDWELATRLSYFLWASAPDAELRDEAEAGRLQDPDVLVAQARRMMRDPRIRRLATEFALAWLHIYDFESLDEKSERHFPTFVDLRGAMQEESVLFFTDVFQNDRSVLSIFDADHTFLNEALAAHYEIPGVSGAEWRRVEGVKAYSRGGVLAMATTLAKQSGASRTSPILRGNWISEVLLGDKLPRPPKGVPPLPEDEADETLTVRELVEKHSSDPQCVTCHRRIDGYGFALEGFDAVGRARTSDLAGRRIETQAELFDGSQVSGFEDLREYLLTRKREVVLQQFCRKLLGYALGRGVLLSDKPLLAQMQQNLSENDFRFSAAVETLLRSQQFRQIRGKDRNDPH